MSWLDVVIVICVATGLIKGLFDGFVKQAVSFIGLVAAIFFAGQIAVPVRLFLLNHVSGELISLPVLSGLCYILAFSLIIIVIALLGKVVSVAIKYTPVRPLNILLGGLFGVFIWILSLSILFNILAVFDTGSTIVSKSTQEKSLYYHKVKAIVPDLYPVLKNYFQK